MKALIPQVVLAVVVASGAIACGHRKPREARSSTSPAAAEKQRCDVKGFTYEVPAPGPIVDARDGGAP